MKCTEYGYMDMREREIEREGGLSSTEDFPAHVDYQRVYMFPVPCPPNGMAPPVPHSPKKPTICILFPAIEIQRVPICSISKLYATYIRPTCCPCIYIHASFLPGMPIQAIAYLYIYNIHQLPVFYPYIEPI